MTTATAVQELADRPQLSEEVEVFLKLIASIVTRPAVQPVAQEG